MTTSFKVTIISMYALISLALLLSAILNPMFLVIACGFFSFVLLLFLFITNKLKFIHYITIMIPSVVLSPFMQFPGLPAIKLEDMWLAFGGILLAIKIAKEKNLKFICPSYAKTFSVFIVWIAFTIFLSSYREPHLYSNRDWMEIIKNVKLLIILLLAVNVKLEGNKQKKIVNTMIITMLVASAFGFMQYFNFLNVNSWLTPHYIFEAKIRDLENQNRVVSTFGNPNTYAGALLIGIAFSFCEFLKSYKIKYALCLMVFFVALMTSLSRTALVVSLIMISIMSFMIFWKTRHKIKMLFYFSFIPLIFLIGLQFAPDRFFYRMSFLDDVSQDTSFQARLGIWRLIFETRTKINLLTGTGPVKQIHFEFDNEWLMLLTYYGTIGIAIFLTIFVGVYLKLGEMKNNNNNFYNLAAKALMSAFAVYMITMPAFQQLQLMPMITLMLGIVLNKSAINNEE